MNVGRLHERGSESAVCVHSRTAFTCVVVEANLENGKNQVKSHEDTRARGGGRGAVVGVPGRPGARPHGCGACPEHATDPTGLHRPPPTRPAARTPSACKSTCQAESRPVEKSWGVGSAPRSDQRSHLHIT